MTDQIREKLEKKYGLEFLTPAEVDTEATRASGSGRLHGRPLDDNGTIAFDRTKGVDDQADIRKDAKPGSVADLILQMGTAAHGMSASNPHRQLMLNAANTLNALCNDLWAAQQERRPWVVRVFSDAYWKLVSGRRNRQRRAGTR